MRLLFAASEVFPLIKTGGLADVAGALPAALVQAGHDVRVLMPGYPAALAQVQDIQVVGGLGDPLSVGAEARLLSGRIPGSDVIVWLVDCPALYDRAGGPYQDAHGHDHADNHLRFGLLSWAAAHLCTQGSPVQWQPDILHCHDWQTGLAPAYLRAWNVVDRPATVFTIHNIAYQGQFPADTTARLGLPWEMYTMDGLEYYGGLSFLKAGLAYSDKLTTVSPRYAREIQSAPHGCGLEGLLSYRSADLVGILNGADYGIWDPSRDACLSEPYDFHDPIPGKAANKRALQAELGLDQDPDSPLLIIVSRLNDLKGMDMVLAVLPTILGRGAQMAVLGSGDRGLEDAFRAVAQANPSRMAVRIGYSEELAHRLMAAGDVLVMPSRFEPCGLTQFYAYRYGTVPLVHATGGLADTVFDTSYDAMMSGRATGFVFEHANAGAFQWCVERTIDFYRQPDQWHRVQSAGGAMDFSWGRSTQSYLALYHSLRPTQEGGQ